MNTLELLATAISALQRYPNDPDAVVQAGLTLEKLISDDDDALPGVDALEAVLAALQRLYQDDLLCPLRTRDAAAAVLCALVAYLEGTGDAQPLEAALDSLAAAIDSDEADDDAGDDSADDICLTTTPGGGLHALAARMVLVNPDDTDSVASLYDQARQFLLTEGIPDRMHAPLGELVAALEHAAGGDLRAFSLAESLMETVIDLDEMLELGLETAQDDGAEPDACEDPTPHGDASTEAPAETPPAIAGDTPLPPDADRELLSEFVTECGELVANAEAALLVLESDPEDAEAINTVFRAFHTMKGTAGFLGIDHMAQLAHLAENLLTRMRDQEIRCTGGYADLALRSVDLIKACIASVQDSLSSGWLRCPEGLTNLMEVLTSPEAHGISAGTTRPNTPELASEATGTDSDEDNTVVTPAPPSPVRSAPQAARRSLTVEDSSVRVRTERLDRLIETVGELVIAQSMVAQDPAVISGAYYDLTKKVTHAGKIVRELQELSMSMRMIPLRGTFQKIARLVRDLGRTCGKTVQLITSGEETEIDRNMVDVLADPLVHLVRNAVDHGLETPEERTAAHKSPTGLIALNAYHAGENVVVEVTDDGKGLDRDRIVARAVANGLIDSDKGLSDSDVYELIFAPGFSTAEAVTEVSGRGVGMDVVRRSIESLHGKIEIQSMPGRGSTFRLRLPLTLAITDGMLVQIGPERYIVPTANIHLSFRPEPDSLFSIEGRGEMVMLRNELMPVYRLHRLFGVEGAVENPVDGLLIVVGSADRRCALLVDELLGQQQVVAKALSEALGRIQGVSGAAILGDGQVGLIIDTNAVLSLARQGSGATRMAAAAAS